MSFGEQVFGYFMPTVNLMGAGSAKQVGEQMAVIGVKKALIVTDKYLNEIGMVDEIIGYIEKAGAKAVVFDGAEPNPTDKNVEAGLAVFKKNNCDSIISIGGGSSHDCAKGVRIVVASKITKVLINLPVHLSQ